MFLGVLASLCFPAEAAHNPILSLTEVQVQYHFLVDLNHRFLYLW